MNELTSGKMCMKEVARRTPAPKHNSIDVIRFFRRECLPPSDQPMKRLQDVKRELSATDFSASLF